VLVYNMGVAVLLGWAGSWLLTYVIDDSYPISDHTSGCCLTVRRMME
jgi:hypothetical protein